MGITAEDALALSMSYSDTVVTGDLQITETSDGGLQFSANGGSSIVVLGPNKVRGRGIKTAAINNTQHLIITYSDDEVEDLGLIKIKGDRISINENTEFKMNLKITKYDDNGNESEEITDNLKPAVIKVKEDDLNDDVNYRVNFITYDENGDPYKTITSPNMIPPKHSITPNENNNDYSFKVNISTKDENGTKLEITPNLKGNIFWEGIDIVGESMMFEVKADDGINYSRKNDLYLNSETGNIYKRTDTGNVNNFWTKIGSLKGPIGNSAYQEAVEEGFTGTRAEWLLTLVAQSNLTEKRWEKPLITDEGTDMRIWYYYQIDGNEPNTAWKYILTPPDGVYTAGDYAFNLNTKYYTFTSTKDLVIGDAGVYDVKYIADEKNRKLTAYLTNKETSEETEYTMDITIQSGVPEGFIEVTVNTTPLGKWVQTMYLGSSKTNCEEITITTGMALDGIITSDVFYDVIGDSVLKIGINVKDAINKMFDMIKSDPDVVLNTNSNTLFEAVNELVAKNYIDCYELIDDNLLTHCLSSEYKPLSSNFIYCENCTNTPKDNNGYGYAMLIVSQDIHCRQVLFFDPINGKISSNNIGDNDDKTDFGNWSGWYSASDDVTTHASDTDIHTSPTEKASYIKKTDMTTTIDRTSTDTQVPSAKAVYNNVIKNNNIKTYTSLEQLGLTAPVTTGELFNAMPSDSIARIPTTIEETIIISDVPYPYGILLIDKSYSDRFDIEFKKSHGGASVDGTKWIGQLKGVDGTELSWNRVCTTSVADVPKTDITFIDSNVSKDLYEICQYCVLNNICYVTLNGLKFNSSYVNQTSFANLPKPVFRQDFALTNSYGDTTLGKLFLETNGAIHLYTRVTPVPDNGFISFSYPVAEE